MTTLNADLNAEFPGFTAAEFQDLKQSAPKSGYTANRTAVKSDLGESEPGEFYWHEDTPAVHLWRGALAAFRHMLGMKI
jgi:hypothetical protein